MAPPKVKCITKVLHPNIDQKGGVCLNVLREDWTPSLDLYAVICGLLHLFYFPNPDDPLDHGTRLSFSRACCARAHECLQMLLNCSKRTRLPLSDVLSLC